MKTFIVISCLVLAATAKPQGYVYEKPNNDGLSVSLLLPPSQNHQIPTSFPALSHGSHTTQYSNSHSYSPISSHGSLGLGSHSSGGSLSLGSSYSVGHGSSGHSFGGNSFGGNSFGGNSFGSSGNSLGSFSSSGSSFGAGDGLSLGLQAPVPAPAPPAFVPAATNTVVQKHIYVHVPPPEHDEQELSLPIAPVQQAQKHYKIIFIKAPSGPSISQQLAQAQQQQSEEKTLVYVLVKKPESIEELQIPRAPLSQPSKPEVYFIKYKAQTANGGFSAPQPIGLSAPSAVGGGGGGAADFGSADLGSSSAAAAVVTSSQAATHDTSSSLSGTDAVNIAAVIQPRTPAPEYGPPKH